MSKLLLEASGYSGTVDIVTNFSKEFGYKTQKSIGNSIVILNADNRTMSTFNKVSTEKTASYPRVTLSSIRDLVYVGLLMSGRIQLTGSSESQINATICDRNAKNTEEIIQSNISFIRNYGYKPIFDALLNKRVSNFDTIGSAVDNSKHFSVNIITCSTGDTSFKYGSLSFIMQQSVPLSRIPINISKDAVESMFFGCSASDFIDQTRSIGVHSRIENLLVGGREDVKLESSKISQYFGNITLSFPVFVSVRAGDKFEIYTVYDFLQMVELPPRMLINTVKRDGPLTARTPIGKFADSSVSANGLGRIQVLPTQAYVMNPIHWMTGLNSSAVLADFDV